MLTLKGKIAVHVGNDDDCSKKCLDIIENIL
jgi:hypothetical protein